jgi:hypothetical protein
MIFMLNSRIALPIPVYASFWSGLMVAYPSKIVSPIMKNVMRLLVAAALAAVAFEFRADSSSPVQTDASRPSQTGYTLKRITLRSVHHRQAAMPRLRIKESTSGNWSGYAVPLETSGVTDTFSNVQGSWAIPTVTGAKRTDTYLATWVGIDGYTDGTVEQIGSEQDWVGSGQQNYVWFEMYPSDSYEIVGFPANPGDKITAQVHYVGQTSVSEGRGKSVEESVFQLTIENTTKNVSFTVPASYTTVATAARGSAEWIAEAPSSRQVLPVSDFGSVIFSNCSATSTRSGGLAEPISFWPYDPITLVDGSSGDATPSALTASGTAFSVSYSP